MQTEEVNEKEMPAPVDQRCPENKFWANVFNQVWWLLTRLPYGENYAKWLQLRHPINAHKVQNYW